MTKALLNYLGTEFNIKSYQIDIDFPVVSKEDIITAVTENLRYIKRFLIHLYSETS